MTINLNEGGCIGVVALALAIIVCAWASCEKVDTNATKEIRKARIEKGLEK